MALGLTGHLRCARVCVRRAVACGSAMLDLAGMWRHLWLICDLIAPSPPADRRPPARPPAACCSCLAATDLYRYLAQEHDATIIGVLLGMAASKRCAAAHGVLRCVLRCAAGCGVVLRGWQEKLRTASSSSLASHTHLFAVCCLLLTSCLPLSLPSPCGPRRVCRGSQDATISKTLFLHLPTRHPSSYPELDISPLVQAAALAGVGLLFQGTAHR